MNTKFHVVEGGKEGGKSRSIFRDLEALKIPPDEDEDPREDRVEEFPHTQAGTFAMVPMDTWFQRLSEIKASGDLCRLAIVLLYRANLRPRFPVTSREMFAAKVGTQHKRALLKRLEAAGLIAIEWQTAPRVPWVTVLDRARRYRKPARTSPNG